jgi:hypothetical protein
MLQKIFQMQQENNVNVVNLCDRVNNLEEKIDFLTNEVVSFSANHNESFIKVFIYNYI